MPLWDQATVFRLSEPAHNALYRHGFRSGVGKCLVYGGVYPASQLCRRIPRENAGTVLLVFGGNDRDRAGTAAVYAASPVDGGSGIYDFQHTVVAACTGRNFA